jgi:transposase
MGDAISSMAFIRSMVGRCCYLDRRYADKNLNAQSLIELFTVMMARHPETKLFRIYLDNARYQHAVVLKEWVAQMKQGRGVTFDLKYLPAYSPNVNVIERLWKFLRKKALQKWHPTFEEMQKAVADVLDNLDRYQSELDSFVAYAVCVGVPLRRVFAVCA